MPAGGALEKIESESTLPDDSATTPVGSSVENVDSEASGRETATLGSMDVPKPDVPKDEVGALDVPKDKVGALDVPKDEVGALDVPKDEVGTLDVPKDEVGALDVPKDEVGTLDVQKDEVGTLDVPKDEVGAPAAGDAQGAGSKQTLESFAGMDKAVQYCRCGQPRIPRYISDRLWSKHLESCSESGNPR